jgi:alpha-glucosidase
MITWVSEAYTQNKALSLNSPDKTITCSITLKDTIKISIVKNNEVLLSPSSIFLETRELKTIGIQSELKELHRRTGNDTIVAVISSKRKKVPDYYNELQFIFKNNSSFIVRCYNDGAAYRFTTEFDDSLTVMHENLDLNFPRGYHCWFPEIQKKDGLDIFHTSFEENYKYLAVDEITENQTAYVPLLLKSPGEMCIAVAESDVIDYPGIFITKGSRKSLKAIFPRAPMTEEVMGGEFKQFVVKSRAEYLAKTTGSRSFPWRVFIIGKERELPGNDLVYRLAEESQVQDLSWIKPGKCTDEWIIGINLFNVPFKAGLNTASYKYYIDFASESGIPYVMLDAGWSDVDDLFKINPSVNMDEIVSYARTKGVGLFLWTQAMTLDRQLEETMDRFVEWGIKGFMTDFIDRNDQKAINFYHRIARSASDHKLMMMFHGAASNAGFERTWPHTLTREGVLGSEFNIWSDRVTPDHDVILPFTRMLAGPFDYEPIVFNNSSKGTFKASQENVMTMGSRIHQLAMYVVYDSPLQIFAGNPGFAKAEPEFTRFMNSIPVIWDETIVLDGKCGEYIVTARRSGTDWYIGAMTGWSARELTINTDFLNTGSFTIIEYQDGINADRFAADYSVSKNKISKKITIKMAPGGGYVAKISHQQ